MKSLKKLGFSVMAAMLLFTVVSCKTDDESSHTHTFATEWASDETHHWYAATCEHTSEVKDKAEHTPDAGSVKKEPTATEHGEKEFKCTVCEKVLKTEPIPATGSTDPTSPTEHEHTFATAWTSDDTHHWHAATCEHTSEVKDKAEHTPDAGSIKKQPTETEHGEKEYKCTACEKVLKTEPIPATELEHTFATEWTSDETHHWHAATCAHTDEVNDKAEHTWGSGTITPKPDTSEAEKKYNCTVCNKEKTETVSLENKKINDKTFEKTSEVVVITTETTVCMTDDSSWSGYVTGTGIENNIDYKGVFIKDRSVTLSPFAMGQYEVTQEFFEAVMGTNPSSFKDNPASGENQNLRPVEQVNWYDAIAFCNKLSILEGLEPCYTVEGVDFETLKYSDLPDPAQESTPKWSTTIGKWNHATCDFTKNGYRLPTEAEWEYAARGGKDSETWGYSYAGVNTGSPENFISSKPLVATNDTAIEDYAWYSYNSKTSSNSNGTTHEVGLKKPNSLKLYDMSGNVYERCWDWYNATVSTDAVINPAGPSRSGDSKILRGGSWINGTNYCAVSTRMYSILYSRDDIHGLRLVRSL